MGSASLAEPRLIQIWYHKWGECVCILLGGWIFEARGRPVLDRVMASALDQGHPPSDLWHLIWQRGIKTAVELRLLIS